MQKKILIGKILGDGSLVSTGGKNYRLQVEQSVKQKNYVDWLASVFGKWLVSAPKFLPQHNSYRFRTLAHSQLTEFQKIFYRSGRKIVPRSIRRLLDHPISLAVWFMDDGARSSSKSSVTFSTHCYTEAENNLLIDCLHSNFKLPANLNWDGKGFRLYIPVNGIPRFRELVSPYILPMMEYKLPLTP
ncbi:MAG: hypothetical protein HYV42_02585 [Candidatus Magasanikbacteria bacterium]|nr:hypothetical protein [Candidatus Magasanikbacteria bacterium]